MGTKTPRLLTHSQYLDVPVSQTVCPAGGVIESDYDRPDSGAEGSHEVDNCPFGAATLQRLHNVYRHDAMRTAPCKLAILPTPREN